VAELAGVRKRYGATVALDGVSLALRAGEVVSLLGPNGAGKTTAVAILLGLRRPDEGEARLFGADPRRASSRRLVGASPQDVAFSPTLTVREIADLVRAHYEEPEDAAELLERFGLSPLARRQAGGLSGGQRRRLAVALAFAGRPRAVFLDEPTTGLDVESQRGLWDAVRAFAAGGGTVLLTTHRLEEADALADRIVVLASGRVVADGAPAAIKALAGLSRIRLRATALPPVEGVERLELDSGCATLYTRDPGAVVRRLVHAEVGLDGLEVLPVSLEDAFVALTREPE
jgi:ABC-2 type transport system ATP-binding protein